MELFTTVHISDKVHPITHSTKLMAMGSCFAEHIGGRLEKNHFDIILNSFGISYHPLAIHQQILRLINDQPYTEEELHLNNGIWHSWDHHTRFSHPEKSQCLENINKEYKVAQKQLENLDHLMITFGTAYGYRLKGKNLLVTNCHKYPADRFDKFLSEPEELVIAWTELIHLLKSKNKKLKFTLTVSPVRHKKEGLVENNRSKSRCLYLTEKLCETFTDCFYFPAYEIVIDELRDYRFFNTDLVHPSEQAIGYIWEKYSALFFKDETLAINKKLNSFYDASNHRPFLPNSTAHQEFLRKELNKLIAFKEQHPNINIEKIEKAFEEGIK